MRASVIIKREKKNSLLLFHAWFTRYFPVGIRVPIMYIGRHEIVLKKYTRRQVADSPANDDPIRLR